jgi:hypothetical protein
LCLVINGGDVRRECAAIHGGHAEEFRVRDNMKFVIISLSPLGAKILNYRVEHVAIALWTFRHQWYAVCGHYVRYLALRLPRKISARTVVTLLEGLGQYVDASVDYWGGTWHGILVRVIFIFWNNTAFPFIGNKQSS